MQFYVLPSLCLVFLFVIFTDGFTTNPYDNEGHEEEYQSLNAWDPPRKFKEDFPYYLSGYDYEGRPVWVFNFWKWNLKKLIGESKTNLNSFEKYCEQSRFRIYNSPKYTPAKLNASSDKDFFGVDSWVFLVNMDGYDLTQLINLSSITHTRLLCPNGVIHFGNYRVDTALGKLFEIVRKLEIIADNMDYGFFINTNFFAERFINTLKPMLGRTLAKIDICGTSKKSWFPALLKSIPRESLPQEFGGFSNHTEIVQ